MPAGVSWGVYLKFLTAAMVFMFAGAQTIHMIYKPLDDMGEWVEKARLQLNDDSLAANDRLLNKNKDSVESN